MDLSGALASFSSSYGLLAVFVVMLVKEIGVPVPVPSDLLMVGAGLQIAAGLYSAVELAVALAVAVLVGGSVQFLLARSAGRVIVYRLAALVGIGSERLDGAVARLGVGGPRAVFLGLNIPGARAAVIPAAGLARVAFLPFIAAALAGSLVFYGWHVALGYLAGPAALTLAERYSLAALAALLLLGAIALVVWLLIRRRAALRSWTEAACPVCLVITALRASSRSYYQKVCKRPGRLPFPFATKEADLGLAPEGEEESPRVPQRYVHAVPCGELGIHRGLRARQGPAVRAAAA